MVPAVLSHLWLGVVGGIETAKTRLDRSEEIALQAVRWMAAMVLLAVGTALIAAAAYVAYVARLWAAAARGERVT